ncbi:23S rRNA (guanosine(2251)-2'-O)-methyltransferase RlmB [Elstera sp.]|jgi:23S rRNA (guanosine2251-2'-O)-methyltransferase|uniref:23S rRNA (guanosine(2251)-2'-O)-methyltransferase RlmB n=1 Tax=Elstera sp. TaxID=1916664 RepID=UPI0037C16575
MPPSRPPRANAPRGPRPNSPSPAKAQGQDLRRDDAPRGRRGSGRAEGGSSQNWLFGHHAVRAALANPERTCRQLLLTPEAAKDWVSTGLTPTIVDRTEIDRYVPAGAVHQGVALLADPLPELALEDVLFSAAPDALFVLLDQVTDPHNVGAILRSCAVFGVTALIMPDRNAATATGTLAKTASGALEAVPVVRVVNLSRTIRQLQEADVWVIGLEGIAEKPLEAVLRPGRIALVLGAEGPGLRRLTGETCDTLGHLPTAGEFASLNVSNAAAVALYATRRVLAGETV